jgi:hypothetical protein
MFCLISFVILFLGAPLSAVPKAEFREEIWDFGEVVEGASATHMFRLRNVGDLPLVVDHVKVGCSCLSASLSSDTLQPGEEADLRVTFHSFRMKGRFSKAVHLTTNDPNRFKSVVRVTGTIVPERIPGIQIEPRKLELDTLHLGDETWFHVLVINTGNVTYDLDRVIVSSGLTLHTEDIPPLEPGDSLRLEFHFIAESVGPIREIATLSSTSDDQRGEELPFSVTGEVVE